MKRALYILVFLSIISTSAFAGQNVVTSKTIGISDIQNYVQMVWKSEYPNDSTSVIGIYQTGNSAKVYFTYRETSGNIGTKTYTFIRFNSMKWYHPDKRRFVTK